MSDVGRVNYVKALRLGKRAYEVGCEYVDGTYSVDGLYTDGIKAENRAKKLAKWCNCEYGIDY